MYFPDKLPIERIENYHTHFLGETINRKLFWGYETFIITRKMNELNGEDWRKFRKQYAVLHLFDLDGNYKETKYQRVEDSFDRHLITEKLHELVAELGPVLFRDIAVGLFKTVIDGTEFGLIADEVNNTIELQPNSTIEFSPPWDGAYDT